MIIDNGSSDTNSLSEKNVKDFKRGFAVVVSRGPFSEGDPLYSPRPKLMLTYAGRKDNFDNPDSKRSCIIF